MNFKLNLIVVSLVVASLLAGIASANTLVIRPNGQGAYSGWTNSGCSSGASEWQCVDENPANTSDTLYTASKNINESFVFSDTGFTTQVVNSLTLYFYGQRYSSTRYSFQPLIRSAGNNYVGPTKTMTSSYSYYSQIYSTNPATGSAWTIAEVDALEAGMKSANSNQGGRIAQVYAVVDYSNPDSCSDTDGGNVITQFGATSGYLNNTYYSSSDYCVDAGNVLENYCVGTSSQSLAQSCGTDGYAGGNYCSLGDVYRDYTDYSCGGGACNSNTTPILQQDCTAGQFCSNGQCLQSDSCTDNDGGIVLWWPSNVTGYLNQSYYVNNDFCVSNTTVREYYCSGAYQNSVDSSCVTNSTSRCYYGACI